MTQSIAVNCRHGTMKPRGTKDQFRTWPNGVDELQVASHTQGTDSMAPLITGFLESWVHVAAWSPMQPANLGTQ